MENNTMYRKVPVGDRLPEEGKWVVCVDTAGELAVYRRFGAGWNMRDAMGDNSPCNNLPITHWLEEADMPGVLEKAEKWDTLYDRVRQEVHGGMSNVAMETVAMMMGFE
jgi:hypothetical protein